MELNIVAVTINQILCDRKFTKVLSEDYYLFNDRVIIDENRRIVLNPCYKHNSWYFGKNINVQAIVGPNGSGKSSLLELLYRIINNFSALVERGINRRASLRLLFVEGVYADLYYVQDGQLYCISCRGNEVLFLHNNQKKIVLFANRGKFGYDGNTLLIKDMALLAEKLHYTIVTNYSLQSLICSDYKDETSLAPDKEGVFSPEQEGTVWINHLYHKNDGYLTPIVLNPYRDIEGNINMITERHLATYRLSALLLYYRNRKSFFDDYHLDEIQYEFSLSTVHEKFQKGGLADSQLMKAIWNVDTFVRDNQNSTLSILLKEMGYENLRLDHDITRAAVLYLVYKILSIASKYPSYSDYVEWTIKTVDKNNLKEEEIQSLRSLVSKIKRDRSHITIKIVQVCNLLKIIQKCGANVLNRESFGIDEYRHILGESVVKARNELVNIMYLLPPSFFHPTLTIKKKDGGLPIEISKISSGERQLIYTFSTYAYHIRNLLSIPKERIAYRHINLILDEAEICFHPEYQRLFVSRLLYLIKSLHLNNYCAFNIFIATHSPFILSDIPRNNILYLDKGVAQKREDFVKPLAANVSDILYQSFFLRNGFIGELARQKINEIFRRRTKWERLSFEEQSFIDEIGDEYVKKQIKRHLGANVQ